MGNERQASHHWRAGTPAHKAAPQARNRPQGRQGRPDSKRAAATRSACRRWPSQERQIWRLYLLRAQRQAALAASYRSQRPAHPSPAALSGAFRRRLEDVEREWPANRSANGALGEPMAPSGTAVLVSGNQVRCPRNRITSDATAPGASATPKCSCTLASESSSKRRVKRSGRSQRRKSRKHNRLRDECQSFGGYGCFHVFYSPRKQRLCAEIQGQKLVLQVPRLQRVTRATSDRYRTTTGVVPVHYRRRAGLAPGLRKLGPRKPPRLNLSRAS